MFKAVLITFCFLPFLAWSYPKVQVDTLIDFSAEDSASLKTELLILQKILDTPKFWEGILKAEFYCRNQRILHHYRKRGGEFPRKKKDKHTYTNKEIHDLLFWGDDELGEPKDGVLNFRLKSKVFKKNRNGSITHGTTSRNTMIISSSSKTRINNPKKGSYAIHLLHEYMHILGFMHKNNLPSKNKKKCGGVDIPLRIQLIAKGVLRGLN